MLTKLRFKNWRSLRDVTIEDLTPLTVFIGANSSGKTNIVDGLQFFRDITLDGPLPAVYSRGGLDKIHTLEINQKQPVELELTFLPNRNNSPLTYALELHTQSMRSDIEVREILKDNENIWLEDNGSGSDVSFRTGIDIVREFMNFKNFNWGGKTGLSLLGPITQNEPIHQIYQFITQRWQLLAEGFAPIHRLELGEPARLDVIDRQARYLSLILDYLSKSEPEVYIELQSDLKTLLDHVVTLQSRASEKEAWFYVQETGHLRHEPPTISTGTARLIAMLTAYYILDIRSLKSLPGLLVIEEPDTALNPGILRVFVDLLRRYVSREEYPRQIILTTHNPYFLDFFEPDEVRVVERDREGYSHVNRIDLAVWDIWKDQYTLGQVWLANSFGGLPL